MDENKILDLYKKGSVSSKGINSAPIFYEIVKDLVGNTNGVPFVTGNRELLEECKVNYLPHLTFMDEFSAWILSGFADKIMNSKEDLSSFDFSFGFDILSPYEENEGKDFIYLSYKLNSLPSVLVDFSFKRDEDGAPGYSIRGRVKPLRYTNELERKALDIASR